MLRNPFWIALAVMLLITAGLAVLAVRGDWIPWNDWVGWIQAVGSVEAILAAIFIAQAEHWNERHKQERLDAIERRALVLELMPQITGLRSWVERQCREIKAIQAMGREERSLAVHTMNPPMPRAFESPTTRLLCLGDDPGSRAVQIREVLYILRAQVGQFGTSSQRITGPNPQVSPQVAAVFHTILSLDLISAKLMEEITAMHDSIFPTDASAETHGAHG